MTGVLINEFGGIAPIFSPRKLPAGLAVKAENIRIEAGCLRPMYPPVAVAGATQPENYISQRIVKSMYRYHHADGTSEWLIDYDAEVSRARVPGINDTYSRIVEARRDVENGAVAYPTLRTTSDIYRLGLPAPSAPPTVAVGDVDADATEAEVEYVSYITTYTDKFGYEGPPSPPSTLVRKLRTTSSNNAATVDFDPPLDAGGVNTNIGDGGVTGAQITFLRDPQAGPVQPTWGVVCAESTSVTSHTLSPLVAGTKVYATSGAWKLVCTAASGGNVGSGEILEVTTGPNPSNFHSKTGTLMVYFPSPGAIRARILGADATTWLTGSTLSAPAGATTNWSSSDSPIAFSIINRAGKPFAAGDTFYIPYTTNASGQVSAAATLAGVQTGAGLFDLISPAGGVIKQALRVGKTYGSTSWYFKFAIPPVVGVSASTTDRPYKVGDAFKVKTQEDTYSLSRAIDTGARAGFYRAVDGSLNTSATGTVTYISGDAVGSQSPPTVDMTPYYIYPNKVRGTQGIRNRVGGSYTTDRGDAPWKILVTAASTSGGSASKYRVYRPVPKNLSTSSGYGSTADTIDHGTWGGITSAANPGGGATAVAAGDLVRGMPVRLHPSTGALPTGLSSSTTYYIIPVSSTQSKLATSYEDALAGTAVTFTPSTGTGASGAEMRTWKYDETAEWGMGDISHNVGDSAVSAKEIAVRIKALADPACQNMVQYDYFLFYTTEKVVVQDTTTQRFLVAPEDITLLRDNDGRLPTVSSTFTAAAGTTITLAAGIPTATAVRFTTTNTLPTPLLAETTYFLRLVSGSAYSVHDSLEALQSNTPVTLTSSGTGTHTVTSIPQWEVFTDAPFTNPYVSFTINSGLVSYQPLDFFRSGAASLAGGATLSFPDSLEMETVTLGGVSVTRPKYHQLIGGYRNVYRSNTGSSSTEYQFVDRVLISASRMIDVVPSDALQEVCPSLTWIAPPDDSLDALGVPKYKQSLQKIVSLPGGVFAGYFESTVCFSEPGIPTAWPSAYRVHVRHPIVDIAPLRDGLLVLTTAAPVLLVGNQPGAIGQMSLDARFACINPRSVVPIGGAVFYAAKEGLIRADSSGATNITAPLLSEQQWRDEDADAANIRFAPSLIQCAFQHEGRYIATLLKIVVSGFTTTYIPRTFILDPRGDTPVLTTCTPGALAAAVDAAGDGETYVITADAPLPGDAAADTRLARWEDPTGSVLTYQWLSGVYRFPKAVAMSTVRVDREVEDPTPAPLTCNIWDPDPNSVAGAGLSILTTTAKRIGGGWRARDLQVQVTGKASVAQVGFWDSMSEVQ